MVDLKKLGDTLKTKKVEEKITLEKLERSESV